MVYMLGFLVAALGLSTATASVFAALHNEVTADAYEISGLYLYDAEANAPVPARSPSTRRATSCSCSAPTMGGKRYR